MIHQLITEREPKLFEVFRDSRQSENAAIAVAVSCLSLTHNLQGSVQFLFIRVMALAHEYYISREP